MDNITLARLLDETAALLEIDGADPFRVRSYRRAAEAIEQQTTNLAALVLGRLRQRRRQRAQRNSTVLALEHERQEIALLSPGRHSASHLENAA